MLPSYRADGAHVELESRGLALLTWLGSLCSQTDGLRRVVAQELVAATRLPTPANASPLSETPLGSSAEEHSTSSRTGAGNGKRGSNWEFNSSLWRRSDVFGLSAERGYLRVNRIRGDGDGIPAEAAAPYWAAREAPLGVLIGADPMLARPLRMALHGLLMRLLVDQEFKRDFALAFARLYEVRFVFCFVFFCVCFFRGVTCDRQDNRIVVLSNGGKGHAVDDVDDVDVPFFCMILPF